MRVICSYCGEDLGHKAPLDSDAITHTMCEPCFEHFDAQWAGLSLDSYLDRFDVPVLVVDSDRRAVATNRALREMLGWDRRDLIGRRGGEVMECVYARQPGGCGQQEHCKTCTVRRTVMHTQRTGEACEGVLAYLDRTDQRLRLRISTRGIQDQLVQVVMEEIEEV